METVQTKKPRATLELDAAGQSMGRLATQVATILRGKHKPTFRPYLDEGDRVVILNVDKIVLTGQKREQKVYFSYSGYPGGLKRKKIADVLKKDPSEVLRRAVLQMLPPTRLRAGMMKRLSFKK